jgi:hypothetical protein
VRFCPHPRLVALLAALIFLSTARVYADEDEKQQEPDGTYTIKLVSADEEGEIIDEFALLQEDAMVESASRHKQEIGMSPAAISVITRKDIEASGAETITDILRMVPGMDVVVSTQFQTSLSARLDWNDENFYFLILIDGRVANLELLGQTPLEAQPISLEDIQRIEVIRGPASSLYGANALAGVISITTRAVSEGTSGWVRFAGGEVGLMFVGARASTRLGNWGLSVSGGANVAGSFTNQHKLGREVFKFRAVAEHRWSNTRKLLIDAGISRGEGMLSASVGMMHAVMQIRMVRLAYQSADIRGHLYWTQIPATVSMNAPLYFAGIHLADFIPISADAHTVDLEAQWTLPEFFEPLMIIAGGTGRVSWLGSDKLLDAETYGDITSPDYHKPGISHWQGRGAAFVHAELAPFDWVTVTGELGDRGVSQPPASGHLPAGGRTVPAHGNNPGLPQAQLHGDPHAPERGVPGRKPHNRRLPGRLPRVHDPGNRQYQAGQRGAAFLRGGLPGPVYGQEAQREPGPLLQQIFECHRPR